MSNDQRRAEKDAVTVGQLRKRQTDLLDKQIVELAGIIRDGYFNLPKAEAFLKEQIAGTLTKLQNIDAWASNEVIFPSDKS